MNLIGELPGGVLLTPEVTLELTLLSLGPAAFFKKVKSDFILGGSRKGPHMARRRFENKIIIKTFKEYYRKGTTLKK